MVNNFLNILTIIFHINERGELLGVVLALDLRTVRNDGPGLLELI